MTPEETQSELDKSRAIIFATIEYTIQKEAGQLKPEQVEYSGNFHRIWKEQVEDQYQSKDLQKLKKSLDTVTLRYKITGDTDLITYIKEKTGYDFDLLGNIYERVDKIIARGRIANRKERNDVATMMELYRRNSIGQENAALLINMSFDFANAQAKEKSPEKIMSFVKYLQETNSPDNKRYFHLYESSYSDYPSTYLNIVFENGASSSVFAAEGIHLGIAANWKDNHTLIIKIKKEAKVFMKHARQEHGGDYITVEYVEI